jgi:hypothetical protein
MERPELKQALGRLLGPAPEVAATSASTSSTVTWSSKWPAVTSTLPSLVCVRTLERCPPAARTTRACTRWSVASRLSNAAQGLAAFTFGSRRGVGL